VSRWTLANADHAELHRWSRHHDPIARMRARRELRIDAEVIVLIRGLRHPSGYGRQLRRLEWIENWYQPGKPRRINGRLRRKNR
jgi:hypothetical protein